MTLEYCRVFLSAFLLVLLVSAGTVFQSHFAYSLAMMNGFLISAVWWFNSRRAARTELPRAWVIYAFGAATGTVVGMKLASLFV